ncbi:shikimate dehydrogenase family protein, partial [Komagataeibacter saccharivorans]
NRDPDKARTIAALVADNTPCGAEVMAWDGEISVPEGTDIVINATSIGLGDAQALPPIRLETLRRGMVVADVIPNPPMTHLLRKARTQGCTVLDGLGMLVNQGVIGVELWLGRKLDSGVMQRTLQEIFGVSD